MASRNKTRSLTGRDEDVLLSPVQRMWGKIPLGDPAIARLIIFDPSLDAV
jgi:hypothetical protein